MMAVPAYQQRVSEFVNAQKLETSVPVRLLDLASEVGELAKESLKGSRYGVQPFEPTPDWEGELADVFFSLICVANSTGVDMAKALEGALAKYQQRITASGDSGSGR